MNQFANIRLPDILTNHNIQWDQINLSTRYCDLNFFSYTLSNTEKKRKPMICPHCNSRMDNYETSSNEKSQVTFYHCSICVALHVSSTPVCEKPMIGFHQPPSLNFSTIFPTGYTQSPQLFKNNCQMNQQGDKFMRREYIHSTHINDRSTHRVTRSKWLHWILYLPGAFVLSYGLWLSISLK